MSDNANNKTTVIILNGPKGIGKDTLGTLLCDRLGAEHLEFKSRLFELALDVSGIGEGAWFERYNNRIPVDMKEEPWDALGGLSQRQFLIRISEEWIKPTFGTHYFGEYALNEALNANNTVVFTDGGFDAECKPFLDDPNVELVCFHLSRNGFQYDATDSRDYITCIPKTFGLVLEDGKPEVAVDAMCRILDNLHTGLDFGV